MSLPSTATKRRLAGMLWVGLSLAAAVAVAAPAAPVDIVIKVAPPQFVLPQFTGPYTEREASIAPEEYEMAERLKSLLDSGQEQAVVAELEKFYDIELSPAMLALKGQIYASLKMYAQAEKTYLAVLQRQPQLVRVNSDLAQLYLVQEKFAEARKYFAKAVALGSNDALVHGQLGYLNMKQYGPFSAISSYQAAMALEPDSQQWQQGLLAALTQANMYEAAQALIKELLAKRPGEAVLWLNHAALSFQQDDTRAALASIEMAMLLGDDDKHNLTTAAKLHLQLGHYDRAIALFERGLNKRELEFAALDEALSWLIQSKMLVKAHELLTVVEPRSAKLSSDERSNYYRHRASLDHANNKLPEASEHYRKALSANPANAKAVLDYAGLLAEQKQFVDAELMYMRAEAIDSVGKEALLGRAQLYIEMQDYPAALTQLRTVLNRYPEVRGLADNIETVENIIRTTQKVKTSTTNN